jgi:predicted esterase
MSPGADEAGDDDVGVVEHHLHVARSARYWTLGDPAGAEELWIVLHGYGQLARRFLRRFECLAGDRRLIVAPEALSRFYIGSREGRQAPDPRTGAPLVGATWMTREDREAEIRDYVAYLDRLAAEVVRGAPRTTVLGFSQGVATAWRWITYGGFPPGLARVISWAGVVPPDLDVSRAAEALTGAEVLLVSGEWDTTVPPAAIEEAAARLEAVGIAPRVLRHPGAHDIDEETLRRITG